MSRVFYPKLAMQNIKKNASTYVPYILTCVGAIMMYYMLYAISGNEGLDKMPGSSALKDVLGLGNNVMAVFSAIFLFYTNSFLMKRRKKELGLYNILGMEKRHIGRTLFFEVLFTAVISLAVGLLSGVVVSKLMFLVLLKILHFSIPINFSISLPAILATLALFAVIFLLCLLFNFGQIHLSNPIELLRGNESGEKEPKTKWITALFGAACLITAYIISLNTANPIDALYLFFLAVILVIAGTYALFMAGSIALLKILRKNKKFYYQTRHFTAVSGMIYRMKQNAAGLANICLLSTMVLVILSTTVSLNLGMEDILKERFPKDVSVLTNHGTPENAQKIRELVHTKLEKYKVETEGVTEYFYQSLTTVLRGDTFGTDEPDDLSANDVCAVYLLSQSEYNRMAGQDVTLGEQEALVSLTDQRLPSDRFRFAGREFTIAQRIPEFAKTNRGTISVIQTCYMVVQNDAIIRDIYETATGSIWEANQFVLKFDTPVKNENSYACMEEIQKDIKELGTGAQVESTQLSRQSFYSLYGGFLFLGIFLGFLFLMATVLIIYYKQISEGYDDKKRFAIMQKVGMSRHEIRRSIHSQILLVFFLPLVMAIVHIAFSFPVITKLLSLMNLNNVSLFFVCTVVTILVFAVIYAVVYAMTARTYYKIVR